MHTGGFTELPLVWKPFLNLPLSLLLIMLVPGVVAGLIGYFIFKSRVKGVYFFIISQVLTWAAYSIFIALSPYTNGNVGITEIKSIFGSIKGSSNIGNMLLLFYVALLIMILTLYHGGKSKDMAGKLICVGMASWLAFQTFTNIAVAMGLFPTTGVTLPFFSRGVSSLLSIYIGMGIVLNIGLQRKTK